MPFYAGQKKFPPKSQDRCGGGGEGCQSPPPPRPLFSGTRSACVLRSASHGRMRLALLSHPIRPPAYVPLRVHSSRSASVESWGLVAPLVSLDGVIDVSFEVPPAATPAAADSGPGTSPSGNSAQSPSSDLSKSPSCDSDPARLNLGLDLDLGRLTSSDISAVVDTLGPPPDVSALADMPSLGLAGAQIPDPLRRSTSTSTADTSTVRSTAEPDATPDSLAPAEDASHVARMVTLELDDPDAPDAADGRASPTKGGRGVSFHQKACGEAGPGRLFFGVDGGPRHV